MSERLVLLGLLSSITLVRLPSFIGHKSALVPVALAVLALVVAWGIPRVRPGSLANPTSLLGFGFALLLAITVVRGARLGAYGSVSNAGAQAATFFTFVGLGVVAIGSASNRLMLNRRLVAIASAPVAYVAVNGLMQLAGARNPAPEGVTAGRPAEVLGLFGVSAVRERLPLTTSINLFSIVAAAAISAVVILRVRKHLTGWRFWVPTVLATWCLLLGDSRGAMIIAILVTAIFLMRVRIPAAVIGVIIPLLPVLVLGVIAVLADSSVGGQLSRSGGGGFNSVATATGRLYIWEGSWNILRHFPLQEIYGWGAGGHITSGASLHYAFVFPGNPEATSVFTHNVVLQMLFDAGLLGLALLVAVIWRTWAVLAAEVRRFPDSPAAALLAILLVVILSGATEVSPTYYAEEVLMSTLLIIGAAGGLASWADEPPPGAQAQPRYP